MQKEYTEQEICIMFNNAARLLSEYNPKNIKEKFKVEYKIDINDNKEKFFKITDEKEIILKLSTVKNKIGEILSIFKYNTPLTEEQNDDQLKLRITVDMLRDKIGTIPKEKYDKELKLENLKKIWKKYDKNDYYKLIVGLYLFIPALRSDYINGTIEKNNIVISNYVKVNKHLGATIKIPNQLKSYIKEFKHLPKNSNAFIAALRKASNDIFGKEYSIDIYRRAWGEFSIKMNETEIRKIAKAMNHSYETHCLIYSPKIASV